VIFFSAIDVQTPKTLSKMKKLLVITGLLVISMLVHGQKVEKVLKSKNITEFKNRMYISTSRDPLAIIKAKTIKDKELAAQGLVKPLNVTKSKLKDGSSGETLIDTTHTYPWIPETQQWDTIPIAKMISYYDNQHNLVKYLTFTWSTDISGWQENLQFLYTYNESNLVVNVVQQSWQFDGISDYTWVNVDNSTYEYNLLGQELRFIYQYWDFAINNWEDSWKQEFTYDEIGNNILILESYWDAGTGLWNPGINFINQFDALNHRTLNPIQLWDKNSNDWINAYQYVYNYDFTGNNTGVQIQTWNIGLSIWDNYFIESLTYNSSNKIDSYLVKIWDPFLFDWFDSQRGIYKYDSLGNNICILGEDYDPSSNSWNTSWANYFDYNDQNKQISNSSLYWDLGLGNWASGSKTKSLKINLFNQNVVKQNIAIALEAYPNPASELVYIRNNVAINQVQVFDMLGNEMLFKNYNGACRIQLDITNLKPGMYFLMMKDSNGISSSKKIIKQ